MLRFSPLLLLLSLLAACGAGGDDSAPPLVSILSPASGSPVSGTATVQVGADDDRGVTNVKLYVRGRGSEEEGVQVASTTEGPPYVLSWYTPGQPNLSDLELVAVARDTGGNESTSDPVAVRVQNSNVPTLQLLTAFTLPPGDPVATQGVGGFLPSSLLPGGPAAVLPPAGIDLAKVTTSDALTSSLSPQAGERSYVLEWNWEPFLTGADGYGVYLSSDLAGPYELQGRYSATAGSGVQKHSRTVEAGPGSGFHGTVTAVTSGATAETGFSNADGTTFLAAQEAVSPADGVSVPTGRPTLAWSATPGAAGYLYYLYDKNPWEAGATLLWSNFPNSTEGRTATLPAGHEALSSGTYWWWVAGVSFDARGKADGFTFSEPRRLVVP